LFSQIPISSVSFLSISSYDLRLCRECHGLGNAEIDIAVFDLADLASVREYANKALDSNTKIDVLINNAGVMACPEMRTRDGFEYQLGVNHLGHFLLTNMLLPLLKESGQTARVVNVASAAHYFGTMNFDDLNYRLPGSYDRWRAYGQSKLANILFTRELARRLPSNAGVVVNCLHPGIVATELGRFLLPDGGKDEGDISWWQNSLVSMAKSVFLSPQQGALTSVYVATSSEVEGITGEYFDQCKQAGSSAESKDARIASKLWDVSAELVKLQ